MIRWVVQISVKNVAKGGNTDGHCRFGELFDLETKNQPLLGHFQENKTSSAPLTDTPPPPADNSQTLNNVFHSNWLLSTKMALGLGYLIGPPLLAMIMAVSSDKGTNSLYTTAALFGIASLLAFACYFVNKRHNF